MNGPTTTLLNTNKGPGCPVTICVLQHIQIMLRLGLRNIGNYLLHQVRRYMNLPYLFFLPHPNYKVGNYEPMTYIKYKGKTVFFHYCKDSFGKYIP